MEHMIDRRSFLVGSAKLGVVGAAASLVPVPWHRAMAASATRLTVDRRTIEVMGRAASVFGIRQPDGSSGITLDPGDQFRFALVNGVGEEAIIHWHGQKPPYLQDGVADRNAPLLGRASSQSYDYARGEARSVRSARRSGGRRRE